MDKSTRFSTNWVGTKICKNCNNDFIAKSGSARFCDKCKSDMMICPQCGNSKSLYHKFCGSSCASKWNYINNPKISEIIKKGQELGKEIGRHLLRRLAAEQKGKPKHFMRGENNPNWKGGNTKFKRKERHTQMGRIEYKNWRRSVFERDNYTCQECGKIGGELNADHVLPVHIFPENIHDLSNGRTLCVPCHKKTITWGQKVHSLKREDFLCHV